MTELIGNLFAVWAVCTICRHPDAGLAIPVTLVLGLCYFLVARVSKKALYLYPAGFLFAQGWFLLSLMAGVDFFLILCLPLILMFYVAATRFEKKNKSYKDPLIHVGHAFALYLIVRLFQYQSEMNIITILVSSFIYTLVYLFMARQKKDGVFHFGIASFLSIMYYFLLRMFSLTTVENHFTYFTIIALVILGAGFLFHFRKNVLTAKALFGVAIVIPLVTSGFALYHGYLDSARAALFMGAVIIIAMLIQYKKQIYSYLLTLTFGMFLYSFLKASQSKFTQHLVIIFLYLLIILGIFFLLPYIKKLFAYRRFPLILTITNWKGALFYSIPIAGVLIIFVVLYGVTASDHPDMCNSCHQMKTFYESWENSAHKDIKCITCHYEPGLEGKMKGKVTGAVSLTKYLSELYGPKPRTEVPNKVCLQGGCHDQMDMDAEIIHKNEIKFMHGPHMDEIVREKQLRCTTCHSYIVLGEHFTVSDDVCFICHFMEGQDHAAMDDCYLCHGPPPDPVKYNGSEFAHVDFLDMADNVKCSDCHIAVNVGDGHVPTQACLSCHQEEMEIFDDHTIIHDTHITEHKVECFECHTLIKHGSKRMVEEPALDCDECHRKRHSVPEQMYRGTGGQGVEDSPDPMFMVNVVCEACHKYETDLTDAGEITYHVRTASVQACADCHGEGFDEMGLEWQEETKAAIAEIEPLLLRGQRHLASVRSRLSEDQFKDAEALLKRAESNYYFVVADKSSGIHNYMYTTTLLDQVREDLESCLSYR